MSNFLAQYLVDFATFLPSEERVKDVIANASRLTTGLVAPERLAPNPLSTKVLFGNNTWGDISGALPPDVVYEGDLAAIAFSGSASDLITGTVPLLRLPSQVARTDLSNTFSLVNTFDGGIRTAPDSGISFGDGFFMDYADNSITYDNFFGIRFKYDGLNVITASGSLASFTGAITMRDRLAMLSTLGSDTAILELPSWEPTSVTLSHGSFSSNASQVAIRITNAGQLNLNSASGQNLNLATGGVNRLTLNSTVATFSTNLSASEIEALSNIRINTSNDLMFNRAGQTTASTGRVKWWTSGQFGTSIGPSGTDFTIQNWANTVMSISQAGNTSFSGNLSVTGTSSFTGAAIAQAGVTSRDSGNAILSLSSTIAYAGNGNLALYSATSGNGAQIYLGDSNYRNSSYWNSAPGIGAVGSAPTSELAFYVYTGSVNSRTEAGRFTSSSVLQLNGGLTVAGVSNLNNRLNVSVGTTGNTLQATYTNTTTGQPTGFRLANSGWDIGFRTNPSNGWFEITDSGGNIQHRWNAKDYLIASDGRLYFSSQTNFATAGIGAQDVSIGRASAGVLRVYNSAGADGSIQAANGTFSGTVQVGSGPILQNSGGVLDVRNSTNTAWTRLRADEYWLQGNSFSRVAQLNTSSGGWVGGYNINYNGNIINRDSTGPVSGIAYEAESVRFYTALSDVPGPISTTSMSLSPTNLTVNTGNIILSSTSSLYFGTDIIPTISTGPNYTVSNEWYVMFAGAHYFGGASTNTFVVFDTNRADFNRPIRLSSTGPTLKNSSGALQVRNSGDTAFANLEAANGTFSGNVTGTWTGNAVGILYGGTGATTAQGARTNLLPSQTGNSGRVLTTNGTDVSWTAVGTGGVGDVIGPVSSTDNAIVRYDGTTGKLIQNSSATIDDSGNASFTGFVNITTGSSVSQGLRLNSSTSTLGRTASLFIGYPGYYDDNLMILHNSAPAIAISDSSVQSFRNFGLLGAVRQLSHIDNGNNTIIYNSSGNPGVQISALTRMIFGVNLTEQISLTSSLLTVTPNATFSGTVTSAGNIAAQAAANIKVSAIRTGTGPSSISIGAFTSSPAISWDGGDLRFLWQETTETARMFSNGNFRVGGMLQIGGGPFLKNDTGKLLIRNLADSTFADVEALSITSNGRLQSNADIRVYSPTNAETNISFQGAGYRGRYLADGAYDHRIAMNRQYSVPRLHVGSYESEVGTTWQYQGIVALALQLDTSGPLLKNSSGTLQIRNSADTAFVNLNASAATFVSGSIPLYVTRTSVPTVNDNQAIWIGDGTIASSIFFLRAGGGGGAGIGYKQSDSTGHFSVYSGGGGGFITLDTGSGEAMRVVPSMRVLIGTTTDDASSRLQVKGSIAVERADTSDNVVVINSPSWDNSYFAIRHGGLAETAANTTLSVSGAGQSILNSASGQPLNLRIGNSDTLVITSGRSIQQPVGIWHGDLGGLARYYYASSSTSYYRGHGSLPHEWRNSADGTIMTLGSGGQLSLLDVRPIVITPALGTISIRASTGGWANDLRFLGSSGTHLTGFGASGTNDTLSYAYIGTFASPVATFLSNGNIGIGTTNPAAKLEVNSGYIRINGGSVFPPASGKGLELTFDEGSNVGYLFAYDRSTSSVLETRLGVNTLTLFPSGHARFSSTLQIDGVSGPIIRNNGSTFELVNSTQAAYYDLTTKNITLTNTTVGSNATPSESSIKFSTFGYAYPAGIIIGRAYSSNAAHGDIIIHATPNSGAFTPTDDLVLRGNTGNVEINRGRLVLVDTVNTSSWGLKTQFSDSSGQLDFVNHSNLTQMKLTQGGLLTVVGALGVGADPGPNRLHLAAATAGSSVTFLNSIVSVKANTDTSAHFRLTRTGLSEWYLNHNGGGSLELALAANLANPDFSFASGGLFVANSQVKLGNTSGVRLKNSSGTLQVRNDADSDFAPIRASMFVGQGDDRLQTMAAGQPWQLLTGAGSALGIKVGNLVVSNSYSDTAPVNGLFVKGSIVSENQATIRYGLSIQDLSTGVGHYLFYKNTGDNSFYFRDLINSRMQMTFNPGSTSSLATTIIGSKLTVDSSAIFNSTVQIGGGSGVFLQSSLDNLQVRNGANTGYSGIFASRAFIGKQYFGDTFYNFSNGYLIATDIPATADRMIEFTIECNTYDNAKGPSFTRVQAYNYNSGPSTTIINQRGMSTDKDLTFEMFHYNGFVYAWFTQTSLFQTYTIKLISPFADHIITSITNAAKPTVGVTNSVTVPMLQWWNQANDGAGSGMDADLLDGQHGSYYATASSVAGTLNYVPKFTSSSAIGNSQIFDDGTNVGIGTTTLTHKLTVNGTASFGGGVSAAGGTVTTGGNNSYAQLMIGSAADQDAFRIIQAGNWWLGPTENTGLHLQTNSLTRLTIANNGNSIFSNDLLVSGNLQTNGTFTATNGYSYLYGAAIQQPADGPSVQMNPGRLSIGGAACEISIQDRDAADNTFRSVLYSNGGLFRVWRGTDRFTVSSTATTVIDQLNVNSGIVRLGTSTNPEVGPGTSDGSDNRILLLVGGGAYGPTTRGAHISVHGLDSATRPGNIELWAGQNGDIRLGGEQGGGHTIALTVRPNGSLRHRTNVWHQDDTGANRYYYTNNGTTFYSGQGATAHIFRNGSDVNLVSIDQNGLLVTQGTNSGIDTLDRVSGERWLWYGSGGIARLYNSVAAADLLLITNTGNTTFGNSILFDKLTGNPRLFAALPMTYQVNLNTGVQHNFLSANGASFTSGDIVRISGSAGYPDTVNMLSIHNSSGVSSFNVKQDGRIGSNMEGVSLSNISVAPFLTSARVGVNIFDYGVLGNNVNQSAFNVSYMGGSLSGVLAPVTNDYRNILTFRTGGTSAALSNTPSFAIRCTIGSTIGSSMSDVITDFMTTSTATGTTISKIKIQANTNTVDIPQGQLTIFEGSNYTRIERTSNGRLTVYRPNDVSTPAVSFGGGNDEIQIRSGLGLIAHSGANFSVIAPSGGGTLTLGSTSSNVFISAGGGAPTITSTATNHYLRAPDGTAFLYANSTSATTEGLMYWGNSTSHGGVALAAIQSSLGRIGYFSWYKPNGTRQGYFGYDNGNDITLTNEVGGNFAVNTGIYAATRVRVGTNSLNEFDLELDNYGRARVTTATAVGWLSRNSLSEWGAQVSAGGDWEVMQYSPSIFRRLWVTQAGEVYTQNQISSASAVGNVTLDIRAIASQTGRLLRFLNSSSSEIGFVTPSGDASFNGSLGIGNTSPLFKAQITGSFNAGDGTFVNTNTNMNLFFDGDVSYLHTPGAMIRKDSSATVPADILATLVLYNRNGTNNTGSKLAFVANETTSTSANAVTTAAIVSQKVSGNDSGWATGNLKFLIKSASTYVEAMTIDASGRVGIGADPITNTRLYVKESGSSTTTWRGRIVAGGDNVAFLMGEYNSQAWLGAHNAALNAWQVLKINPDGNQELHLGNFGSAGAAPILTLANSTGAANFRGTVQIGSSGPILQNNSGILEVRNSGNTDYNPIRSQNITIINPLGGSFASPASGRLDFRTQGISYLAGSISGRSYTANSARGDVVISANPNITVLDYSNLSDDLVVRGDTGNVEVGRGSLISGNSRFFGLTRTLSATVGDFVEIGNFSFTNGSGIIEVFVNVGIAANSQTKHYIIPAQFNGTSNTWRKVPANNASPIYAGNDFDLEVNSASTTTSLRIRKTAGTVGGTIQIHIRHTGNVNDTFTPTTGTGSTGAPTDLSSMYYRENLVIRAIGGSTQDLLTLVNNVGTTVARVKHSGNLGVGVDPVARFHVVEGANTFRFNSGASSITPNVSISTTSGKSLALLVGSAGTSFTFDNTGYFAISSDSKANIDGGSSNGGIELFRIQNTGSVRFIKDVNHEDSDGLSRFIFNNAASTSLRGYSSTPFRLFNASNSEIVSIGQTGIITAGIPFADSKNGTVPTTLYVQNLFNNMGLAHSSVTDFNSINDFGFRYVQGSTNGPGTGSSQFYNITLGLGIDYPYSSFALQLAIPRYNSSDKYLSMRTRESGTWGPWQKIAAGTADGLREFTWSGKPAATSTKGPIMITDTVPANTIWTSDGSVWRSQTRTRKVITYGATLTLDSSEAMVQRITLTGNLTLNKFTNGFDGASLEVLLRQDGTGGRTLTFGTGFRFNDYITSITLSTGANKTDRILFEYDAIDDVWDVISFVKGS